MQDITPFSEGDSQRRICKSFASGACDALRSDNIFASKEALFICQPSYIVHSLVITKYIYIVKAKGDTTSSDELEVPQ